MKGAFNPSDVRHPPRLRPHPRNFSSVNSARVEHHDQAQPRTKPPPEPSTESVVSPPDEPPSTVNSALEATKAVSSVSWSSTEAASDGPWPLSWSLSLTTVIFSDGRGAVNSLINFRVR